MKISDLGEAKILNWIERNYRFQKDSRLIIGPGDDAAVLKTSSGRVLLITTDEMVDGVHFINYPKYPVEIAQKLIRINLSDLAAMGNVRPLACVAGAGLPGNVSVEWVKKFTRSLAIESHRFGISLAGGNLSRAKTLHVYATVLGEARREEIITRYGAKPGDYVYSTGFLGDARVGLEILKNPKFGNLRGCCRKLLQRFWKPEPMFKTGEILGKFRIATSLIDNSDGLMKSLEIISKSSKCRIRICLDKKAVSKELIEYSEFKKADWQDYALSGGEDYGLIFTAKPDNEKRISKLIPHAVKIGTVEKGRGNHSVVSHWDGSLEGVPGQGILVENYEGKAKTFEHF